MRSAALAPLFCAVAAALVPPTTVVLGGGFAGLYTALNLASDGSKVQLVDSKPQFEFLPLLYEYASGIAEEAEVSATFEDLTRGTSVEFIQGDVAAIDTATRTATLKCGRALCGDALVIALGRESALDVVPGALDFALPFYRLADAIAVKAKLATLDKATSSIRIVGAGYTGVELACHLTAFCDDVSLVERSGVLPAATDSNRAAGLAALEQRGIGVRLGTSVVQVAPSSGEAKAGKTALSVAAADGLIECLDVDMVIWTAGARVAPAVRAMPASCKVGRNPNGPLRVDAALRLSGAKNVFALGDAASVAGVSSAPSAQMALQQAVVAARNVRASLAAQTRAPALRAYSYVELGEMLTFGQEDGSMSLLPALLPALQVGGPVAQLARRLVYAVRMPTRAQRVTALAALAPQVPDLAAAATGLRASE